MTGMARVLRHERVRVKATWHDAGREGAVLALPVRLDQWWVAVLWSDSSDPDFHKLAGLDVWIDE